ncbi:hypothetical protein ACFL5G_05070 [Candidatus Margulisiibacteriota bacterium]
MKKWKNDISIIITLLILSLAIYLMHYGIFHDAHHIWIYFIGDLGFIGIQALIIYYVIDRLLKVREKISTRKKLNMLSGIFFYDLGIKVFNSLNIFVKNHSQCAGNVCVQEDWNSGEFKKAEDNAAQLELELVYDGKAMDELAQVLKNGKGMIIRLMENPSLHEHETFSDMLMALFHLTEEVLRRSDLKNNDKEDQGHLLNDIKRLYIYLARLWIEYMQHLKDNYPYLYLYNIKNRQIKFV